MESSNNLLLDTREKPNKPEYDCIKDQTTEKLGHPVTESPIASRKSHILIAVLLASLTVQGTLNLAFSHSIVRKDTATIKPIVAITVIIIEIVKLLVSSVIGSIIRFYRPRPSRIQTLLGSVAHVAFGVWRDAFNLSFRDPLLIPKMSLISGIYVVQNNLSYWSLARLPPTLFQVLQQLKLPINAIFAVIFLKRKFNRTQWFSFLLLGVGVFFVQSVDSHFGSAGISSIQFSTLLPIAVMVLIAFLSGLSGTILEHTLKESSALPEADLGTQGLQLGVPSFILALLFVPWRELAAEPYSWNPLVGFSVNAWIAVSMHAFSGILVAASTKFADSVRKSLATSASVVLYATLSILGVLELMTGSPPRKRESSPFLITISEAQTLLGATCVALAVCLFAIAGRRAVKPKSSY
jgi:drug/metabolite transporter (DMT)-like permease